ncbi:ribonuclease H-like domain-containing protein [Melanogaster broomeanus]|nr:ribonuclease H-like domain-containing protein [Melanogaster broomeanus]
MPKASKHGYYAVRKGRAPGIYLSWLVDRISTKCIQLIQVTVRADCDAQVKGFAGAVYKKLNTEAEAKDFMAAKSSVASTSVAVDAPPVASTSLSAIISDSKMVAKAVETVRSTAKDEQDEQDCDVVYCDGACKGNGQAGSFAGIGVWWGHNDPRNISERCPGDQTNNRAELIAIVRILETTPPLKRRLLIKTDSHYSIQCVSSWIFQWMRNGFRTSDGSPVKNRAVIKYLAALLHARRTTSQTVEFKHVRGHVGIEGNEAADQLANLGVTKPVLPERDWEKLEDEVLRSLKLNKFKPAKMVDDKLKAHADGHLGNEFPNAADPSIGGMKPAQQLPKPSSRSGETTKCPPSTSSVPTASVVPAKVPPPNAISVVAPAAVLDDKNSGFGSSHKLLSAGAPGSTSVTKLVPKLPPPKSGPSISPTAAFSRDELEAYASCLLDDDEAANLGKDGTFDSDF